MAFGSVADLNIYSKEALNGASGLNIQKNTSFY